MLERTEIDVLQSNELKTAVELAVVNSVPALVVHQSLVGEAIMLRLVRQGLFKIITPIDWSPPYKGENYGNLKLRGTLASALQADGFEVLLTPGRTPDETVAEANTIAETLRQVSRTAEIRFALHMHSREAESLDMYRALLNVRRPAMVRTDVHTKLQTKVNAQTHQEMCKTLKSIAQLPLKVSGNVATWRALQECTKADRVAVSLSQFETIIKELQRLPPEIKGMLI